MGERDKSGVFLQIWKGTHKDYKFSPLKLIYVLSFTCPERCRDIPPEKSSGWCVWITGLPGSGKSTISHLLQRRLKDKNIDAQIVSSDMLRKVITPNPRYTDEEREIVYGAIVFIAKLLTENGVNVIIDATANRRRYRDRARREISKFIEAYVKCPLNICIQRESKRKRLYHAPKGVYEKALTGKSGTVPGIGVPYEEPENPEVTVDSERLNPEECAERILEAILSRYGR